MPLLQGCNPGSTTVHIVYFPLVFTVYPYPEALQCGAHIYWTWQYVTGTRYLNYQITGGREAEKSGGVFSWPASHVRETLLQGPARLVHTRLEGGVWLRNRRQRYQRHRRNRRRIDSGGLSVNTTALSLFFIALLNPKPKGKAKKTFIFWRKE